MSESFQPMPHLTDEQLDALRADIIANGIQMPVVKDQHGRIIDGNNRAAIAADLGIDYPVRVIEVRDDDDAIDRAVALNCARRHLSREQVRELVASEIRRRPDDSDRAVARRVGCSPSTVGAVRAELAERGKPNIVDEVRRYPYDSNHDIASRIRCSQTAVAVVRAELAQGIILSELRLHRSDSDSDIASRISCDQELVESVRATLDESDARKLMEELTAEVDQLQGQIAMIAVLEHEGGRDWQTIGDVHERMTWHQLSNVDHWLADPEMFGPVMGTFFDAIRAHDCDSDCTTCTSHHREWRDAYPQQVYRWPEPEVSNLDSAEVSS